jgi:hypothetical protein
MANVADQGDPAFELCEGVDVFIFGMVKGKLHDRRAIRCGLVMRARDVHPTPCVEDRRRQFQLFSHTFGDGLKFHFPQKAHDRLWFRPFQDQMFQRTI